MAQDTRVTIESGTRDLARFVTAHKTTVLAIVLALTGIFLPGALKVRSDLAIQELFPLDHPYLKLHEDLSRSFGSGASLVAICLKSMDGDIFEPTFLAKLKKLTEEISLDEAVYRKQTISIAGLSSKVLRAHGKGVIAIESLMWPDIPKTLEEMARLRRDLFSNAAYHGTLVSRDGAAALVLTEFKEDVSYDQVHRILQRLVDEYSDAETSVHAVGYPALMAWVHHLRSRVLAVFAVSGFMTALILYGLFRNPAGMIVPVANAAILTIWGLGFIGYAGLNFNPLLYVLGFLVVARVISNANQILARYFEQLEANGNDRDQACLKTMETMLFPNLAAVATDAAGFAVLYLARIPLMQQIAVMMTFWVASIVVTGILTPVLAGLLPLALLRGKSSAGGASLPSLPLPPDIHPPFRQDLPGRMLKAAVRLATGRSGPFAVLLPVVVLFISCGLESRNLQAGAPSSGSPLLWPNHPYNIDQALIDKHFDTSPETLVLFYEGEPESVYDPEVLNTFEAFAGHMRGRLPDIYKSSASINEMIKMVNLSIHDGDEAWDQIPRNLPASRFIIGYLRQSAGEQTMSRFVDGALQRAQMTLFFRDHGSETLSRIRGAAADFFRHYPMETAGGGFRLPGGRIGLEMALNEEIIRAHMIIDATVLAAIFVLCTLFFRSMAAGLMLTLPLLIANSAAFAYMAWHGIGLAVHTLPVAAVGAGIGVDFAIYYYSRCREEFPRQGGDWSKTLEQAANTCGRAVVYTGLTIILPLASWYFLGAMKFQAQMGGFLALIIGMNVLLALTLHPAMIACFKPRFISRQGRPKP